MSPGDPKLVPGQPDVISVWFLGERRIVDRKWYDAVCDLARSNARRPRFDYNSD